MALMARTSNWAAAEVEYLVSLWSEDRVLRIMEGKRKNTEAFAYISEKLTKAGFARTPAQVNGKIKQLRISYYRGRDALAKSGAGRDDIDRMCPYFDELDVFMGTKPLAIPSMLVCSTGMYFFNIGQLHLLNQMGKYSEKFPSG